MDLQIFEAYLKQMQQIAQRLPSDPSALLDIMKLIEKQKLLVEGNSTEWDEFFRAESSFYSGQYEKALQHYLAAKEIPHYHFFCFRTSCFVAKARGNQEQAIKFAKKALKLNSTDEILKQFLHDLNTVSGPKQTENIPKISLGEKEIAELASIFEGAPGESEELFAGKLYESKRMPFGNISAAEEGIGTISSVGNTTVADDELVDVSFYTNPTNTEETAMDAKPQQVNEKEHLAEKLYGSNQKESIASESPLTALKRLAEELPLEPFSTPFGDEKNSDLQGRIEAFQGLQAKRLQDYFAYTNKRQQIADHSLFVLNGWDKFLSQGEMVSQNINAQGFVLTEEARKSSGGLFLRWNGKGIVINPGAGFLHYFHEQGFSLQDIHTVIVTRDNQAAYADIKAIYELNNKLNNLSGQLQIINYYLNQKAYQELTSILKPNFKQARNTVHSLELFIDSPDVEKIEIGSDLTLHYFLASTQEPSYRHIQSKGGQSHRTALGICLELRCSSTDKVPLRLGYISGAAWSPLLAHHFGICDILVAGFGNTSENDYNRVGYQEDSLGYHGSFSLIEEIAPRLFVSAEFGGREGDIRLEAVKKLRQEVAACGRSAPQKTTVIPGDIGLHIDLKTLNIRCPVTGAFIQPEHIRIAKPTDSFGRLLYLSPSCYL